MRAALLVLLAVPTVLLSGCRLGFEELSPHAFESGVGGLGGQSGSGSASGSGSTNGFAGAGSTAGSGGSSSGGVSSGVGGVSGSGADGSGANAGTGGGPSLDCGTWWDPAFAYRRALSFDNSTGADDIDAFPVLVVLDAATFDYDNAAPDGADLRFVDDDHTTVLAHHIESWNPGGASHVWVRVPRIDAGSSGDHIWLYYGSSSGPATNEPGTYDATFAAVWHLDESGGGTFADSTSNAATLTWLATGSGTQGGPGAIGGGVTFDGAVDGATTAANSMPPLQDHTITAWIRPDPAANGYQLQAVFSCEDANSPFSGPGLYYRANTRKLATWVDFNYRFATGSTNELAPDEWNFVAMRGHSATSGGFIDIKRNDGPWETIYSGNTTNIEVVAGSVASVGIYAGASTTFDGDIDEVKVSSSLRSDAWMSAQYRSESNLGFVVDSGEQTCP